MIETVLLVVTALAPLVVDVVRDWPETQPEVLEGRLARKELKCERGSEHACLAAAGLEARLESREAAKSPDAQESPVMERQRSAPEVELGRNRSPWHHLRSPVPRDRDRLNYVVS